MQLWGLLGGSGDLQSVWLNAWDVITTDNTLQSSVQAVELMSAAQNGTGDSAFQYVMDTMTKQLREFLDQLPSSHPLAKRIQRAVEELNEGLKKKTEEPQTDTQEQHKASSDACSSSSSSYISWD
jgi:hypothetical protein